MPVKASEGGRAESQPSKQTHSLQKQDSSKYLRGDGTQVTSQENMEKRVANRASRQKSGLSSQSKPNPTAKVIYKVRRQKPSISEPLFSTRPNFGQVTSPSEQMKRAEEHPSPAQVPEFIFSDHQKGDDWAFLDHGK